MKIFAPTYFKDFKCTAQNCKNNCCIGWEIDVDSKTLEFYKTKPEIIEKIAFQDTPHFILGEYRRCPFLEKNNLCYIIKNYGEENLCQICSDHPRFRSFFDSRTEIGLGLTCEAAARLIFERDFELYEIGEDSIKEFKNSREEEFFIERENIFKSDFDSFSSLVPKIALKDVYSLLSSLERLDTKWDKFLSNIKDSSLLLNRTEIEDKTTAKRLLNYFVFRHYHNFSINFCLACTYIIFSVGTDLYEAARLFSSEIEYSDENLYALSEFFDRYSTYREF